MIYPPGTKFVLLARSAAGTRELAGLFRGGIDLGSPLQEEHVETARRVAYALCQRLEEYDAAAEAERSKRPSRAKPLHEHRIGGWRLRERPDQEVAS